jgi:hypothetical protein
VTSRSTSIVAVVCVFWLSPVGRLSEPGVCVCGCIREDLYFVSIGGARTADEKRGENDGVWFNLSRESLKTLTLSNICAIGC